MAEIVTFDDITPFIDALKPESDIEKALVKCVRILTAELKALKERGSNGEEADGSSGKICSS